MITEHPRPGDRAWMPFDGSAVIEITNVAGQQPHLDREWWVVHDQYGEEHIIELDGDSWITVNPWSI